MKSTIKTLALTTALASPASAAITFTNGGFESGTTLTGSSPYSDVNEWFNTGSGNSASVALSTLDISDSKCCSALL